MRSCPVTEENTAGGKLLILSARERGHGSPRDQHYNQASTPRVPRRPGSVLQGVLEVLGRGLHVLPHVDVQDLDAPAYGLVAHPAVLVAPAQLQETVGLGLEAAHDLTLLRLHPRVRRDRLAEAVHLRVLAGHELPELEGLGAEVQVGGAEPAVGVALRHLEVPEDHLARLVVLELFEEASGRYVVRARALLSQALDDADPGREQLLELDLAADRLRELGVVGAVVVPDLEFPRELLRNDAAEPIEQPD
mmetsp:Transcript_75895/g.214618  ORF Transcript_75895/g.214618 Transcript_75895/m.214618 type:complete len:249 (+) Transcript_75895:86-832(+)